MDAIPEAVRQQANEVVARLRSRTPEEWEIDIFSLTQTGAVLRVASNTGESPVAVWAFKRIEPREVRALPQATGPIIVTAPWLSPRTRAVLRERGLSFMDNTGNAEVRLDDPALYIRTDGADRNPDPLPTTGPTLRGPRAWALLRTLVEVAPPYGVQDLSNALGVDAGYVSRVLRVLQDELLIDREPRGQVMSVDWEGVLRRLTSSYSLLDSNETSTWVAPGGAGQLLTDLPGRRAGEWVVTGSFASASIVSVAAPETAVIYTPDIERLAKAGRLLPATTGANVVLAIPYDEIVFHRTRKSANIPVVSTAQIAADNLTGPGRMPEEAEALITWMRRNPRRWQYGSLNNNEQRTA